MNKVEEISKILELGLRMNCPANVKTAKFFMDYRKDIVMDGNIVHYGVIQLYVETFDDNFVLDYSTFWDYNKNEDSQYAFLESLIDSEDYIHVWDRIDLVKGEWKGRRKKCLI